MKWSRNYAGAWVSDCGRYEIASRYADGHFAWRGREVDTDKLIASSLDPEYVKQSCERHKQAAMTEAS
jgi:hypothetical protein